MNILSIESSCDETAAAVLSGRLEVKSQVVASQINLHRQTGGVVPEVAARAHTENIIPVIATTLKKAGISPQQISAIAVTYGPGLITSLLVGLETAKALAFAWKVPLIGVNHIEGHVLANLVEAPSASKPSLVGKASNKNMANKKKSRQKGSSRGQGSNKSEARLAGDRLRLSKKNLPVLVLTVSGGHTTLLLLDRIGGYRVLGSTRDDAAGEAFDKVARLLGLEYPGGPAIGRLAKQGLADYVEFPRPMLKAAGYDFSFSGLKTAVATHVAGMTRAALAKNRANLAASFQEAVIDTLLGKAARAINQFKAKQLWIVGGVAANQRLRQKAQQLARSKKIKLQIPTLNLCTDNAIMIGVVGVLKYRSRQFTQPDKLQAEPNLDLA